MFPLFILFIGGLILTAGDIVMKKWVLSSAPPTYLLGMVLYIIGLNFLAYSFRFKDIAVASVLFIIFNVITLTIAGWLFFDENITILKLVGLSLALFSIVLLDLA